MATRDATGRFVKKAEKDVEDAHPEQFTVERDQASVAQEQAGAVTTTTQAPQYPTSKLSQAEEQDRLNILKSRLSDGQGNTPFGKLKWSDELGYWLLRKEQAAKKAAFQEWFAKTFDKLDEGRKAVARELYPQFYREREETLNENLDTLKRIVKLRLWGTRTPNDLALKYAYENGLIDLTAIRNMVWPEQSEMQQFRVARFHRGLLNPDTAVDLGYAGDAQYATGNPTRPQYSSPFFNLPAGAAGQVGNYPFIRAEMGGAF